MAPIAVVVLLVSPALVVYEFTILLLLSLAALGLPDRRERSREVRWGLALGIAPDLVLGIVRILLLGLDVSHALGFESSG